MSKDPRRDAIKKALREQERASLVASMPLTCQDLRELFDHLDEGSASGCDHTARNTSDFLKQRGLDELRILAWLREHGGYCDCEVIANVEEKFAGIL